MKQLIAICAFLALAFPFPAFVQSPDSGPALWMVRGQDATVYLFGRMAVRGDTDWLTSSIEEAFEASEVLWLENPSSDSAEFGDLMTEFGFQEGYSVLDSLHETDRMGVVSVLGRGGASPELLEGRKPWLSYLLLTNVTDQLNGIAASPDTFFRGRAEATAKEIRSEWLSMRDFVQFSAGLPEATHLEMIRKTVNDSGSYEDLLQSWLRADLQALSRWSEDLATKYPNAHRQINSERNAKWVAYIEEMVARGGTHFISVGFGHLYGPDGILNRLESTGIVVERL